MTQYAMLIYRDENIDPAPGSDEFGAMMGGYQAFTEEVREKGVLTAGEPLQKLETASTVRVRDGKIETVDGPFAETKEALGGFYILDCKDLDEAIAYAAKIPTAGWGSIEIRPLMVFE